MSRMVSAGPVEALAPGQRKLIFVEGRSIVLFNIDGAIHAVENSCPHNGASLASGQLDGNMLRCPAHGLRFDLTTGCMPGSQPLCLKTYAVSECDGELLVAHDEARQSPLNIE